MLQNNYDALDYKVLKQNYNLNMINFANTQTKFISLIPEQINRLIFIHHIVVIALTMICAILWVKVRHLNKRLKELEEKRYE